MTDTPSTAFELPPRFDGFRMLRTRPGGAFTWSTWWIILFWRAVVTTATEGFSVIRREPRAAFVWMLLWLAAFMFAAVVVASGDPVGLSGHKGAQGLREFSRRFGAFAVLSTAMFLLVWVTTTVAAYRAVLRPDDRRYFFLRLGGDELRLAIMTIISFVLFLVFGGVPAYLLLVVIGPVIRAVPNSTQELEFVGALATVCVDIWLGVRLSLIAVETVAERRFHLTAYWPLVRGRFWYLLAAYFVCFVIVFVLSLLFFLLGGLLTSAAPTVLGEPNLLRRTGVMALAAGLAVLTACFFLLFTTVFCACQAFAFRAIAAAGAEDITIG